MTAPPPEATIIVPCYNEAGNVIPTSRALAGIIDQYHLDAEVVMIDDCSQDTTAREISALAAADPRFRLVKKELPRGMGAAIRAGIQNAKGTWAVVVNGDISDPFEAIPQFQKKIMEEGCDLVLLNRYTNKTDHRTIRRSYKFFQFCFRLLLRIGIGMRQPDITYGYRAFRLSFIRKLRLQSVGFEISPECSVKAFLAGGRIGEVGGQQTQRKIGQSKFYFSRVFKGYALVILRGTLHRFHLRDYV